ncbi:hypothetical protein NFI96_019950 [Prochilodus magdalenae]|nr:hypothetical protein NFI96_019950 [Prochilodus magdalenae]
MMLDRFASIRIPGSKKERPNVSNMTKHSSTSDWSSSSEFEELSSKITSEKEILALFEKMMEDMNLNEDKKAPLRQKDLSTKREMVLQYIVTAAKTVYFVGLSSVCLYILHFNGHNHHRAVPYMSCSWFTYLCGGLLHVLSTAMKNPIQSLQSRPSSWGSLKSSSQISPQEFLSELKSGATDEKLFACLDSLRVSLTSNPVSAQLSSSLFRPCWEELKSLMALGTKDLLSLSVEQLCDSSLPLNLLLLSMMMVCTHHSIEETAGHHSLIEHLQELPTDVKGPQPPQEVESALPLPVQDISVGCPVQPLVQVQSEIPVGPNHLYFNPLDKDRLCWLLSIIVLKFPKAANQKPASSYVRGGTCVLKKDRGFSLERLGSDVLVFAVVLGTWVQSFGHEGLGLLLDILERLLLKKHQEKVDKKSQHKVIQCLKAFMNNKVIPYVNIGFTL